MSATQNLGEFEELVLLAALRLDAGATASAIRRLLTELARRPASRGAIYATLERLEAKGLIRWEGVEGPPVRGGVPARRFRVTPPGLLALQQSRQAVRSLATGLESLLGEGG